MSVTVAAVETARPPGAERRVIKEVTFDSSYLEGGEPLTASELGLKVVKFVNCFMTNGSEEATVRACSPYYTTADSKRLPRPKTWKRSKSSAWPTGSEMGYLHLPSSVTLTPEDAAKEQVLDEVLANAEHWTKELRAIDPYLRLARVGNETDPRTGLIPGCWYIRKVIPDGEDEWMPLIGEVGEPDEGQLREPGPWILDLLNENDMWNPRAHRNRSEAKQRLRDAKVRARKLETEQRKDEMLVAAKSLSRLRSEKGLTHRTDLKR